MLMNLYLGFITNGMVIFFIMLHKLGYSDKLSQKIDYSYIVIMILKHIILKYFFFLILSLHIAIRKNSAQNVRFGVSQTCLGGEYKLLFSFSATVAVFWSSSSENTCFFSFFFFSPYILHKYRSVFPYPRQTLE